MARSRNIKPALFKNEILGMADPMITILFTSLWTLADREGRLEDRPTRIRGETFPYRGHINIEAYLHFLRKHRFIIRYSRYGKNYIQIVNWHRHQKPHWKEPESEIPPPEGYEETIQNVHKKGKRGRPRKNDYTVECNNCTEGGNNCTNKSDNVSDYIPPIHDVSEDKFIYGISEEELRVINSKVQKLHNPDVNATIADVSTSLLDKYGELVNENIEKSIDEIFPKKEDEKNAINSEDAKIAVSVQLPDNPSENGAEKIVNHGASWNPDSLNLIPLTLNNPSDYLKTSEPEPEPKKRRKNPNYTDEDYEVAEWMFETVKKQFPTIKAELSQWATCLRHMREIDGHTMGEIKNLWMWCRQHLFWSGNIRAPTKFRQRKDGVMYWDILRNQQFKSAGKCKDFKETDYQTGATKEDDIDWL